VDEKMIEDGMPKKGNCCVSKLSSGTGETLKHIAKGSATNASVTAKPFGRGIKLDIVRKRI
jgi:hypothetical protein